MINISKLQKMTSEEMIKYDATKNKKISVAKYKNGSWSILHIVTIESWILYMIMK